MNNSVFPEATYVFTWGGLQGKAGGMTRAMLRQMNMLISEGKKCICLCGAKNVEQIENVKYYQAVGFPFIREENFYTLIDFLEDRCNDDYTNESYMEDNYIYPELFNDKENGYYYKFGVPYAKERKLTERAKVIEFLEGNGEDRALYFDNILRRIVTVDGQKRLTRYFSSKGIVLLTVIEKHNEETKNEWICEKIIKFNYSDGTVSTFSKTNDLTKHFFAECIKVIDSNQIFVIHNPLLDFDPGFDEMQSNEKIIYRIGVNHGMGFGEPRDWYATINPRIRDTIEKKISPSIEGYVCLTKEASRDFAKRLGSRNIIYYIPNTIKTFPEMPNFEERQLNRVVYVGRIAKDKQIDHLIKAWQYVELHNNEAVLDIFGDGPKLGELKELAEKLKLQRCNFKGFTDNVNEEFSRSGCTIVCSVFEGFCLSMHEALSNGCPVISYDFKYGPKDSINDGENGLIVPNKQITRLGERIVEYLNYSKEAKKEMSKKAWISVRNLDEVNYRENYCRLFNTIVTRYNTNIYKLRVDYQLKSTESKINGQTEYRIDVFVSGSIPDEAFGCEVFSIRTYNSDRTDFKERRLEWTTKIEKTGFEVCVTTKSTDDASLCFLWNNCYVEKRLSDFDTAIY